MVSVLARKGTSLYNQHFLCRTFNLCFKFLTTIPNKDVEAAASSVSVPPSEYSSSLHLSPFFSDFNHPSTGFDIELVDHDTWGVSSGVAQAWRGPASRASSFDPQVTDEEALDDHVEGELDFEDIDSMRVRGNLFYKLERSSKEFEEYNLDFHRKKSSKKKEEVNKAKTTPNVASKDHKLLTVDELTRSKSVVPRVDEINDGSPLNKRQRTPTFNQLSGPYHEPFCLDIFISKASVRACVVHRVTSKVVAVAHSISKDIKFDLASTKNKTTCAAVGAILAQRALADDIHDVIYTPRKRERVEGKLQIVLQSIIDNGINVKLKIKQRPKKSFNRS
ncbi:50S ribosomal protein L18 [Spatholobus suberectus]|nr:50S ribosomal protein L18 [Spatholobus suberectus]